MKKQERNEIDVEKLLFIALLVDEIEGKTTPEGKKELENITKRRGNLVFSKDLLKEHP